MLGLGRASQLAGWWSAAAVGNLVASINDVTTTTATGGGIVLRPAYSADFSVGSATQELSTGVFATSSTAIDQTGVGTNAKKQIYALTFKVGSDWMTTAPTSTYQQAFDLGMQFNNNGTQSFRSMILAQEPGGANYVFGCGRGPNVYVNKTVFDANYRNKWLTCIFATSNSSSDFANWAGGTDNYGNSWCGRNRLYLTETMTPIPSVYSTNGDGWLFDTTGNTPDLTQAWTLGFGSSSYWLSPYGAFNDSTLYYRRDMEILSAWYTIGDMVDVGDTQYSNQLAGNAFSKTVNSIKPWIAYAFHGAGTPLVNAGDTWAYTNPVYTWGRIPPANVQLQVPFGTASPQPPEFISL